MNQETLKGGFDKKFPVVSFFSGAGGLDSGFFMNRKFQVRFALDKDSVAGNTYSLNHHFRQKGVESQEDSVERTFAVGDVRDLKMKRLKVLDPSVIIGGPPCQDFSIIRGSDSERKGINASRGRLYAYFVKALFTLNPKFFVFENVPGLVSQDNGAAFRIIKDDFIHLTSKVEKIEEITGNGYEGGARGYKILFSGITGASSFGVAQRRQRLIIIGARDDLFEDSPGSLDWAKLKAASLLNPDDSIFKKFPLTPMEVFEGLTIPELGDRYAEVVEEWKADSFKYTAKMNEWFKKNEAVFSGGILNDYLTVNGIASYSSGELNRAWNTHKKILKELGYYNRRLDGESDFDDKSSVIPYESEAVKKRMRNIPPGENYSFVDGTELKVKGNGISLVYRRLHPLKPSYTILARGGGGTHGYHYLKSRSALTNRERARLQSFPDSFKFSGRVGEQRMQIGEAVPPLLAKAISKTIEVIFGKIQIIPSSSEVES